MLTLHSPVRVENHTSVPLDFMLQISRNAHAQGPNQHGTASTTMPPSGPLVPNATCYLPMPAMWYAPSCSDELVHAAWPALMYISNATCLRQVEQA